MSKHLELHGGRIWPLRNRRHHRHLERWRKLDRGDRPSRDRDNRRCCLPHDVGLPGSEFADRSRPASSGRRMVERTGPPRPFPETSISLAAIACPDSLTCVALGTTTSGPAIISTVEWRHQLVARDRSLGSHGAQRNLLFERRNLSGRRFHRAVDRERRRPVDQPGRPARLDRAVGCLLPQLRRSAPPWAGRTSCRRRTAAAHGIRKRSPAGVSNLVAVNCVGPANCVAGGSGTNGGGMIATLLAPPTVTTTSLPGGAIGVPYASSLNATGGLAPYTWSITAGRCHPDCELTPGGTISGTPTLPGDYSVTVTVTDANQLTGSTNLSVDVGAARTSRILGGRQRRRHLQLWRRSVLRLDRRPPPERTDRGHGGHSQRRRLLVAGLRRRDLRLRRCRLLWLDRRHAPQRPDRRHGTDARRSGLLAGRLGRRHLLLWRRGLLRLDRRPQARQAHRRDGVHHRRAWLLARRLRRRRVLVRRRPLRRLGGRLAAPEADRGHGRGSRRRRLLARGLRRRHLQLRRRRLLRLDRRPSPRRPHRRHGAHAQTARGTGSSVETAGCSASATPRSSVPPAACT